MLDGVKKFPKLKDGSIYFIVRLSGRNKNVPASKALVELPTQLLPRFLVLPETGKLKYIIFLDDVIRYCLNIVFSIFGYDQYQAYAIKLTRDSELDMGSDLSESFLVKVSKSLKRRKEGRPVRFIFDKDMDNELLSYLVSKINLKPHDLIPGGRYHDFKDFFRFPGLGIPRLEYPLVTHLKLPEADPDRSIFRVIKRQDLFLSFPYQTDRKSVV